MLAKASREDIDKSSCYCCCWGCCCLLARVVVVVAVVVERGRVVVGKSASDPVEDCTHTPDTACTYCTTAKDGRVRIKKTVKSQKPLTANKLLQKWKRQAVAAVLLH